MEIALLAGNGNAGMMNMVLIVAMLGVFYFFILRPQNKKRKEMEAMRESLSKGDRVMANGIYGKILKIDGDEVTIELEEGKMKVHKNFIEAIPDTTSSTESK
ncbi:MAG: preprotein translocase subunit YajC [Flavobacteriales bacterium]|nr:preprotein translocase subunit YajC [Flavobacteriales bacterium]